MTAKDWLYVIAWFVLGSIGVILLMMGFFKNIEKPNEQQDIDENSDH